MRRLVQFGTFAVLMLGLFLLAQFINTVKENRYVGGGDHTISVTADGEVYAVPDIAEITFTAKGDGADIKAAQTKESTQVNAAIKYLKDASIAEKDIKTTNYYTQPKYENRSYSPCYAVSCPDHTPKIIGYEVYQSVTVKVRDTDKAGDILAGLGGVGVTDLSGPNFSIDDEDALRAEARAMAIKEAREKARVLAKDLGVRIVSISSFTESGDNPIYYSKAGGYDARLESSNQAVAPEIPTGENKIKITVTISYEIR